MNRGCCELKIDKINYKNGQNKKVFIIRKMITCILTISELEWKGSNSDKLEYIFSYIQINTNT